ncbi:MAG: AMP-binding protein [Parasphingorhabdus sp.]
MGEAHSFGKSAEMLEDTIGKHFCKISATNPDHLAIVMPHQDIRWTYSELKNSVDRLAAGLLTIGIQKGDRVGIWSPNRIEWVLTQLATARIGAILVCVNPAYRLYELEYALNKVECKALVTAEAFKTSQYLSMIQALAPELANCEPGQLESAKLPHLRSVIRMGDEVTPGMHNFWDICGLAEKETLKELDALEENLSSKDIINIQFTSGTTGNPKGASLTHTGILNNGYFDALAMNLGTSDRLCIPVPLYHCFGMVMGVLACISVGATMVFPGEAFEPEATMKAVSDEKCTALHGVPTMFFAELDLPNLADFDTSQLRTGMIAGATCPEDLMQRLIGDMDLTELIIAYGQTECSPVNTATAIDDTFEQRTSTVGRPHTNWEIKIIDPKTGQIRAAGETGEVCSRGYGVMAGYWNDEELTRATIDEEGFLHSGDLGEMDAAGYVKITGRIKDMIIRGGENIYPAEIENFLYTHPEIAEVQVFGVPDEKYGEQVAAWVQPRSGSELTPDQVQDYCQGQITHFKIPKFVKIVSDFPMTVTGKMQKFVMREQFAGELGLT